MTRKAAPPPPEWAELSAVWTDPAAAPAPDAAALARAVRRRARLARLNYLTEIVTSLLVLLALGVLTAQGRLALPLALAGAAFALFALGLTLWARRGLGDETASTPEQALRLALRQGQTGLRWARAGLANTVAATIFVAFILSQADGSGEMRVSLGGVALFLGGCALFYAVHARRCRRRMAAHEQVLATLLDAEALDQADSVRDSSASEARPPDTTSPPPMA